MLVVEPQAAANVEHRHVVGEDVADDPPDALPAADLDEPAQELGAQAPALERIGDEQRELGFVAHVLHHQAADRDELLLAGGRGAVAALGFLYFRQGTLHKRRWLLWILVFSVLGPELANQLGWFAAEVGRQPWIVYGVMRTPAGLSAVVKANVVLSSLILFTLIYTLLFAVFIYLLNDKIQHGPDDADLIPSGKLALPTKN